MRIEDEAYKKSAQDRYDEVVETHRGIEYNILNINKAINEEKEAYSKKEEELTKEIESYYEVIKKLEITYTLELSCNCKGEL